ncbi:MAG TPA: hypothetical protein VNC78_00045 [Actinomycetota bacterium]|nr:hypothetical protein [Actinomycetota bacterium]
MTALVKILAATLSLALGIALGLTGAPPVAHSAQAGLGEGLKLLATVPLESGTHMELATIKGRDYAFVSEIARGSGTFNVIDVTTPAKPKLVAEIPCGGNQGNVQISHDLKTAIVGIDEPSIGGCLPPGMMGFVTIDISDPKRPRPLGYAENLRGSHTIATHPTKPYVYNGEGFPEAPGAMQVWSIEDPAHPELVTTVDTGAHSPHDISFNKDGSMAATANVINVHLMDTTDPEAPKIVHTTQCPGCLHNHEARFTPDGKRLVVNDEYPASAACPGGFMYFYDVTESATGPSTSLVGLYTPGDKGANAHNEAGAFCTAHVFDISKDGTKIAASWHAAGIKYLDISEVSGVAVGRDRAPGGGVVELGWYTSRGADAFSAKFFKGPYIYSVDYNHGFQVYRTQDPPKS